MALDRAHYLDEMSHASLGATRKKQSARDEIVRRIAIPPHPDCKNHKESEDSPWAQSRACELSFSPKSNTSQLSPDDEEEPAAGCFYGSGPCAAVHASRFRKSESAIVAEPVEPLYATTLCQANRVSDGRRDYNCPVRGAGPTVDLDARKILHENRHIHAFEPRFRR